MEQQITLQLLNGLVVGSSIALVASGLALLFGVLHIINFAQGDFFMLGAYSVYFLARWTENYVLSVILGTLIVAVSGGILLSLVVWPLLRRSNVLTLLATLGLSLIIQQLAINILGGDAKLVPPPLTATVSLGPVNYPVYFLVVVVIGMGVLLAGAAALKYTKYGIWLRAVAQNRSDRTLLATLGLSLIIQQLAINILGGDAKLVPPPLTATVSLGPVNYPVYFLVVVVIGMGVLLAGAAALKYTKYGIWLRAVAQNR